MLASDILSRSSATGLLGTLPCTPHQSTPWLVFDLMFACYVVTQGFLIDCTLLLQKESHGATDHCFAQHTSKHI